MYLKLNLNSNN